MRSSLLLVLGSWLATTASGAKQDCGVAIWWGGLVNPSQNDCSGDPLVEGGSCVEALNTLLKAAPTALDERRRHGHAAHHRPRRGDPRVQDRDRQGRTYVLRRRVHAELLLRVLVPLAVHFGRRCDEMYPSLCLCVPVLCRPCARM